MIKFPIIDCHIHTDFQSSILRDFSTANKTCAFSKEGLLKEFELNDIESAISMSWRDGNGNISSDEETPIGLNNYSDNERVFLLGGINPHNCADIEKSELALKEKKIHGLKVYLGYYHVAASNERYIPYYDLARKYNVPVVFHTGDTLSKDGKLKFSRPMQIDELAVDFRNVNLVIAHCGNPWFEDTASVLYKNKNVFADLSGLYIGESLNEKERDLYTRKLQDMITYVSDPRKFMFGSDWPLANMSQYVNFVKNIVPESYQKRIFYENARRIFNLE